MQFINCTSNISRFVLAIYLLVIGITGILGISLGALSIVVPLLALVTGVFLLLHK
jgi:hypothetical protein